MLSSVDTLKFSIASSCNSIEPPRKHWLNDDAPAMFRQRTMGSLQTKAASRPLAQRSNSVIGLSTVNDTTKSNRAPDLKTNISSKLNIHKLGTIPNYLNKRTTYTVQSDLTIKRKQFTLRKTKFCEQQKEVLEQYRTLLDMQTKWNRQTGKHTKLEELEVIAYRMDGTFLCLCAGPENYDSIASALSGAEKELNELDRWLSDGGATEMPATGHLDVHVKTVRVDMIDIVMHFSSFIYFATFFYLLNI